MKTCTIRRFGWAALGAAVVAAPLGAQGQGFDLSVTPSTLSVLVSNSVSYTVNLTNRTGLTLADLWVTNSFSAPVRIGTISFSIGNGASYVGSVFTNANTVLFDFSQFRPVGLSLGVAQATFTIVPDAASFSTNGFLTNAVVAIAPALQIATNALSTNVVVQVTNVTFRADLGVSITGLGQGILAGDTITYGVTVTNLGPGNVPNVLLTNTLPAGTALLSVSPVNPPVTLTNGVVVLNLGTLASARFSVVNLTVQPTNAGLQTFSASVGAAGLQDAHPANNTASTTVNIGALVTGQIIATNASPMTLDPQTGLMNQTVRLVNVSTSAVPSVRLTVSGLTNWLYNAVGTNSANPFVVFANTLGVSQSVDLVLEYFVPTRQAISVADSNYTAVAIPAFNPTPPAGTNTEVSVTRAVLLSNGDLLIEFPSIPGANYSIVYSAEATFTKPLLAQPNIIAPADRVQWIDDGPPKTVSSPASATSRFYRVIKN